MGDPQQQKQEKLPPDHGFDAIVVGSGISGGWAAKELCEKGLKTLLLERGRHVTHIKDYPTAPSPPWEFAHRLNHTNAEKAHDPIRSGASDEATALFYVSDTEHPYIQEKPFNWIRGYQLGGRSLTWGRQCYRYNEMDFEANLKDGIAVDWPIRYKDIEPWYTYVEKFVGISGRKEGLSQLPDGEFLPPMDLNCVEEYMAGHLQQKYNDRILTIGRVANLSKGWNGRGPCQYRNLCARGCPFSGYFSSNAATLPVAEATGNLTTVTDAIVVEVLFDEKNNRASGVRVINAHTKQVTDYFAKIIFLNASTIATASILLNSKSNRFPTGLGNSSGQIGLNLMDHFTGTGAEGELDKFNDQYYYGRRPVGFYIPRFRNISAATQQKNYIRGFGIQGMGERASWREQGQKIAGFGKNFKDKLLQPGPWKIWMGGWGETLPYETNKVTLDNEKKDQWGIPLTKIHYEYHDNEEAMRKDILASIEEMLGSAGFKNINSYSYLHPGGSAVHEMGTARMGRDPKTSVLNGFNQMHDVKNVFITDGSCMTSSGTSNPSLTYMALTARACDYAVAELKKGNI
jgi:choline dehydrogenase-like flavoprotein